MQNVSRIILLTMLALLMAPPFAPATPSSELTASVAKIGIGLNGYVIGASLDEKQVVNAKKSMVKESYPGTYKFKDGDIFVVAASTSNTVLAIYRQFGEVSATDLKKQIGRLMAQFGEPTTIAHEKIVYWFYNKEGKISEESLLESKKSGKIDTVLTVKLNSSKEISSATENEGASDAYLLISSESILKQFMAMK